MALSVADFSAVANWFVSTTPRSTAAAVTWSAGDAVVAMWVAENGADAPGGVPTASGLTFVQRASFSTGTSGEGTIFMYSAIAGSSGSAAIQGTMTGGTGQWGICAWVVTGGVLAATSAAADNNTGTTISRTVAAGSVVLYGYSDWNAVAAGKTQAAGSGTANERVDVSNTGLTYGVYAGEWVGTAAGTFGFGVSSYTGLHVAQAALEVTLGTPTSAPAFRPHAMPFG